MKESIQSGRTYLVASIMSLFLFLLAFHQMSSYPLLSSSPIGSIGKGNHRLSQHGDGRSSEKSSSSLLASLLRHHFHIETPENVNVCGWQRQPGSLRMQLDKPLESVWDHLENCESKGMGAFPTKVNLRFLNALVKATSESETIVLPDATIQAGEIESSPLDETLPLDIPTSIDGDLSSPLKITNADRHTEIEAERSAELLEQLAGKRVLLIGDSVDRYMVTEMEGFIASSQPSVVTLIDPPNLPADPNSRVLPHSLYMPFTKPAPVVVGEGDPTTTTTNSTETNIPAITWDFLHFFGVSEEEIWADKGFMYTPPEPMTVRFEAMHALWKDNDYDVISLGMGLWDLARYQRIVLRDTGVDDYMQGLPTAWLVDWMEDARKLIRLTREAWPRARIVWRILHDPRPNSGGWFAPAGIDPSGVKVYAFDRLRVAQFRHAQELVVETEGIESLPLEKIMRGQPEAWLRDQIHPDTAGCAIHAELLLEMMAEV